MSGATEGYLMDKASALLPLFVERENRLRKLAGLPVEGAERVWWRTPLRICCGMPWQIRGFSEPT